MVRIPKEYHQVFHKNLERRSRRKSAVVKRKNDKAKDCDWGELLKRRVIVSGTPSTRMVTAFRKRKTADENRARKKFPKVYEAQDEDIFVGTDLILNNRVQNHLQNYGITPQSKNPKYFVLKIQIDLVVCVTDSFENKNTHPLKIFLIIVIQRTMKAGGPL